MSMKKILYQGVPGSYSYEAMLKFFGKDIKYNNVEKFENVFQGIINKTVDYGIVPVENSTTGGVYDVYDLLSYYNCYVIGEIAIEINHNLLGVEGSTISTIKKVYSHPQALEQCKDFIEKLGIQALPFSNTAASAKMISEKKDITIGAIASNNASNFYNLKIIKPYINNYKNNFTRFIIISNNLEYNSSSNKISLFFSTAHKPGALYEALGYFADSKINLLKLESRPIKDTPWEYSFYLDIEGNLDDENIKLALDKLKSACTCVKLIGNYKCHSILA